MFNVGPFRSQSLTVFGAGAATTPYYGRVQAIHTLLPAYLQFRNCGPAKGGNPFTPLGTGDGRYPPPAVDPPYARHTPGYTRNPKQAARGAGA